MLIVNILILLFLTIFRKRGTIDESQIGATKQKVKVLVLSTLSVVRVIIYLLQIFCGDIGVVMAVEQYASNRDLEVLVALMYDIACDGKVA